MTNKQNKKKKKKKNGESNPSVHTERREPMKTKEVVFAGLEA